MKRQRGRYQVRALTPAMGRLWAALRQRGEVRRGEMFRWSLDIGLDPSHAARLMRQLRRRQLVARHADGAWRPAQTAQLRFDGWERA